MRKSTLTLACLVVIALLASCKKDVQPTITLIQTEGYLTEGAQVYANDDVLVGFVLTGEKLTSIEATVTQNGNLISSYPQSIGEQDTYTSTFHLTIDVTGTVTITGTVTDAAGHTASLSIDVVCNEKPNAKFVGHYEGKALLNGSIALISNGQNMFENQLSDHAVNVVLDLQPGNTMYEVVGTCSIDDQVQNVTGTVSGNTVTFEAIDDVFSMDVPYNGMTFSPEINLTYNITGTLEGNELILSGDCKGSGEINLFLISGDLELDTTVGGSLTKTE